MGWPRLTFTLMSIEFWILKFLWVVRELLNSWLFHLLSLHLSWKKSESWHFPGLFWRTFSFGFTPFENCWVCFFSDTTEWTSTLINALVCVMEATFLGFNFHRYSLSRQLGKFWDFQKWKFTLFHQRILAFLLSPTEWPGLCYNSSACHGINWISFFFFKIPILSDCPSSLSLLPSAILEIFFVLSVRVGGKNRLRWRKALKSKNAWTQINGASHSLCQWFIRYQTTRRHFHFETSRELIKLQINGNPDGKENDFAIGIHPELSSLFQWELNSDVVKCLLTREIQLHKPGWLVRCNISMAFAPFRTNTNLCPVWIDRPFGRLDGWMDGGRKGGMDGWMNEWMDE